MSVSVIIPSYNAGRWVAEAVESALAQTVRPSQIIVVDDGSTDDTPQRLEPYASRGDIEYVRQENAGVSAARNEGVRRATGEFIAFLDADDVWHSRKLETQLRVMAERPELGMLGTATFDWPADMPIAVAPQIGVNDVSLSSLVVRNHFTTSSIVVRRAVLDKVGPRSFDTALHGPEDYDLWLRLAGICRVAILDLQLTGYRSVAASLGKQARSMQSGMRRILEKLDRASVWNGIGGALLRRRAYGYFHYSCAYMYGAAGEQRTAFTQVLRSIAAYPRPFDRGDVMMRLARPKLLGNVILRMMRLKSVERSA